jgi:hypothetical protein
MRYFSRAATLAGTGVLVLGTALAASNVAIVHAAGQVAQPDAICNKVSPCLVKTNHGNGAGIEGISLGSSVSGLTNSAIEGSANGLNGVYGLSTGRNGGFFENKTTSYYTLYAETDATGGFPFAAVGPGGGYFDVDSSGDGYFSGSVNATAFNIDLRTRGGREVSTFPSQATRATIEDTGTARMRSGKGIVRFDADFVSTLDFSSGYQVFLTPSGDNRGLYVASKYQAGFVVRESEGGRSTITFDYRVVGHPVGSTDARLPEVHLTGPDASSKGRVPQQ